MTKSQLKLALLAISLALTVSFISCQSVEWEEPNSAASPLMIYAGSYSLPLTILGSQYFPWPIKLKSNDTRFVFASGFVIPYQGTWANDIMGCAQSVPAGNYVISFSLDNYSWSGPGLLYLQVINTPIGLDIDPVVTISGSSAPGPTFNLVSLDPFVDMTITASVSNNQFTVSPTSVTWRPNSTSQGFTYSTNANTRTDSSATVTLTISGTNAAAYQLSQTSHVVRVPGGSNTTTTNTTTTNTTTGGNTTTNTTTNTTNTTTVATMTLTSTESPMTITAGTYSLPVTLRTSASTFARTVGVTTSNTGFAFNPNLLAVAGSTSASAYLGASGTTPTATTYKVAFVSNDTGFTKPANLSVKVVATKVVINVPPTMTVYYNAGTVTSSQVVTIDLSDNLPWSDVTITPRVRTGAANWIVNPSSLTFSTSTKRATFVFQTSTSARGYLTSNVTYAFSGTNAASYKVSGNTTLYAYQN